jgi:hypothetical protein
MGVMPNWANPLRHLGTIQPSALLCRASDGGWAAISSGDPL